MLEISCQVWNLLDLYSDCVSFEKELITADVGMFPLSTGGLYKVISFSLSLLLQFSNDSLPELLFPDLSPPLPWFEPVDPSVYSIFFLYCRCLPHKRRAVWISWWTRHFCDRVEFMLQWPTCPEIFRKKGAVTFCSCVPFCCSDWHNLVHISMRDLISGTLKASSFFPGMLSFVNEKRGKWMDWLHGWWWRIKETLQSISHKVQALAKIRASLYKFVSGWNMRRCVFQKNTDFCKPCTNLAINLCTACTNLCVCAIWNHSSGFNFSLSWDY